MTNEQGEVVWLADYEAWGAPHKEMCWGHILASQDESYARVEGKEVWHDQKINPLQIEKEHLQPIRFQGQVYDEETGLHYNRFRYYDTDMGMFTSREPIGLMGGSNVFAYAPNPTGWIDPLGLDASLTPNPMGGDPSDAQVISENLCTGTCGCQKVRYSVYVKTIEQAERYNKNAQHVAMASGLALATSLAFLKIPPAIATSIGTITGISSVENSTHVESGDTILVEYTVCDTDSDFGAVVSGQKVTIMRREGTP